MAVSKLLTLLIVLVAGGCAATPEDPNRPVRPACSQNTNCFYERNIRSFQALNDRTVVVLVGRDQCPYRLELDGFFCDVSMSSYIAFDDTDGRICSWDRAYVVGGPFIRENEYCRVRDVIPMTDDELLETYASHGLTPPLPARGSGELEVVEDPDTTPEPIATGETGAPVEPAPTPAPAGPE